MRKATALALILASVGTVGCTRWQWERFTPAGESYSIEFPAKPTQVSDPDAYPPKGWTAKGPNGWNFNVGYEDFSALPAAEQAERELKAYKDMLANPRSPPKLRPDGGMPFTEKQVELGGHIARQRDIVSPRQAFMPSFSLRMVLVEHRLYVMTVYAGGMDEPKGSEVQHFFDSFQLTR